MLSRRVISVPRNYVRWSSAQRKPSPFLRSVVSEYDNYYPNIIDEGIAKATFIEHADMKDRIRRLSTYYERKPIQGEFMTFSYENLAKNEIISKELLHQIQVLVTTVELVQTYFCFWDDYEDGCTTRCGKLCWHLLPNTGSLAVNDAYLLRTFIDELIKQNFKGELCDQILDIYTKEYFIGSMGQHLDTEVTKSRNYDIYTIQTYNDICKMKSAFYSVKAPFLLALALSNRLNEGSYDLIDYIFNDIGILVQVHNDLIDYLITDGLVTKTGKSGTDIHEGKCCWPAVVILQRCNPEQKRIFKENYGSTDPDKVDRILQLYKNFDIRQLYKQEQKARYEMFHKKSKRVA